MAVEDQGTKIWKTIKIPSQNDHKNQNNKIDQKNCLKETRLFSTISKKIREIVVISTIFVFLDFFKNAGNRNS